MRFTLVLAVCLFSALTASDFELYNPSFAPSAFPQDTGMVDHEACEIDIRLFPSRHRIEASACIAFRSLVAGLDRVHFTIYNDTLRIQSVTRGRDTLDFSYEQASATLTVLLGDTLGLGESDTVLVRYTGYITPRLGNYSRLDDTVGFSMIPYIWCPAAYDLYNSSRRDDFSNWRTTLTVPRNWRGLSCGVLLDSTVTDSTVTYVWQPSRAYVAVSFGAGPYQMAMRERGPLHIRYYDSDTSAASAVYSVAGTVLNYLEAAFGEVTLDKLAFFDHRASFGAAHPSLVMMPLPNELLPFAHEIGHHWWGISVTRRFSTETWLNEGFANYTGVLLYEDSLGVESRREVLDHYADGYLAVPPLQDRAIVPDPVGSQYRNAILYQKGAWVLHMLRWVLGDSLFFAGMRSYAETYRDGAVEIDDFRHRMEQVSGRALDWFFSEWLYWTGVPEYSYWWRADSIGPARCSVRVCVVQEAALFDMPVQVSAFSNGVPTDTWVRVHNSADTVWFEVTARPDSVVLDREDWVLDRGIEHVGVGERDEGGRVRAARGLPTVVLGLLALGARSEFDDPNSVMSRTALLDVAGRRVAELSPGSNDVSRLAPGVYFIETKDRAGFAKVQITR